MQTSIVPEHHTGKIQNAKSYGPKSTILPGRICQYKPKRDLFLTEINPVTLRHWAKESKLDDDSLDALQVSFGYRPTANQHMTCQETRDILTKKFNIQEAFRNLQPEQFTAMKSGKCSYNAVDAQALKALCNLWDSKRHQQQQPKDLSVANYRHTRLVSIITKKLHCVIQRTILNSIQIHKLYQWKSPICPTF